MVDLPFACDTFGQNFSDAFSCSNDPDAGCTDRSFSEDSTLMFDSFMVVVYEKVATWLRPGMTSGCFSFQVGDGKHILGCFQQINGCTCRRQ